MPGSKGEAKSLGDSRTFKAGYAHIRKNDAKLRPILDARGLLEFHPQGEPFESLVESILSQQVAGAAASAIIKKVRALFPDGELEAKRIHRIDPKKLRAAGASPQKLSYLKDLAARVVDGMLDLEALESMPDGKIMQVLDEVRGIGPWTVHMFLIFTLGRPDVLPVDDYGIKTSVQRIYGFANPPKSSDIEKVAERWHPYSTVASLYLWHSRDNEG
ncbi:MAG: DNA-3-methyladenine glycosylase [Thaumarchaeota archaeon]|nr:DNA-3-methyladenine glycosylase [Nitrososphaerota archaeon]